ncbi:MAG: ornithine carbamoyltransferase, partial [Bacillota bacterium]|nr:ornithine carbamoyltransferase [Bacillota bacterium]
MIQSVQVQDEKEAIRTALKKKDFLTLGEFDSKELLYMLDEAMQLKQMQKAGKPHPFLNGKVLGMIFEKS